MALYTRSRLAEIYRLNVVTARVTESASYYLSESIRKAASYQTFDIFLSHNYLDAKEIAGLKLDLEAMGYSVYVDWLEDPQLDRTKVTKETAEALCRRMDQCKALFYASTENATTSKWMPWELGYVHGSTEKVAIVPILQFDPGTDDYRGQEYLGIYPYAVKTNTSLWIHRDRSRYVGARDWLDGKNRI